MSNLDISDLGRRQFYAQHQNFNPVDASMVRTIGALFNTIVRGFWLSLGSYFRAVPLATTGQNTIASSSLSLPASSTPALIDTDIEGFESVKKPVQNSSSTDDPDREIAINELKKKRPLSPTAVTQVLNVHIKKKKNSVMNVTNFLFNCTSSVLPDIEKDATLVLIPVVLKGTLRDHIVAVVYDTTQNRVELFDPKGLTSKDRDGEYVRCNEKRTLSDVLLLVAKKYGNAHTCIWENTSQHQIDSHNCGVYVLDYFERRAVTGNSPQTIAAAPLSFTDANNERRMHFIEKISE